MTAWQPLLLFTMSLYDDLPPAAQAQQQTASTLWSEAPAPPAAAAKKTAPAVLAAPLSVLRKASAPAERPRAPKVAAQSLHGPPAPPAAAPPSTEAQVGGGGQALLAEVEDEYDPAQPNSYEDVLRARALQQKQAELAEKRKALEKHRVELLLEARKRAEATAAQQHADLPLPPPPPLPAGMQLPPPPPLPPAQHLPAVVDEELPDTAQAANTAAADGKTAAQRMMERMGWREGQGLGKAGDGMTSCLVVRKTDARAGVIVNAPAPKVTSVLCLRGMVLPGEVDEALEDEVAEECEKFGPVTTVVIFEAIGNVPPALAVRIFVQFTRVESAVKAKAEMDGRFFGGRQVTAHFFDEERFDAQDFAPQEGEFGET